MFDGVSFFEFKIALYCRWYREAAIIIFTEQVRSHRFLAFLGRESKVVNLLHNKSGLNFQQFTEI